MCCRASHQNTRLLVRGVKAPPLLDGRQGRHVAVPVEGQEAHGAALLQRPDRSCPPDCPASLARASGRCATRRTLAPPWRRCRGASSRGAAWRQSRRTPPPRLAAAARPAAGTRRAACPRRRLREARRQLMAAGKSPKVAISSPAQYCGLRLRRGTSSPTFNVAWKQARRQLLHLSETQR